MGIEIAMGCDRKVTNIAKSQVGFIDFVIYPYFEALAKILPQMQYACTQMRENKETWAKKVEEYQKILDDTGNEKF
jgi:hypothetical protein